MGANKNRHKTVEKALHFQRALTDMLKILFLTDLHFNNEKRQESAYYKRVEQLLFSVALPHEFDALVVTGDFTSHGAPEEFRQARSFLETLYKKMRLPVTRVYLCPGNHDADTPWSNSGFEHYRDFLQDIYRGKTPDLIDKDGMTYAFYSFQTCSRTSLEYFDDGFVLDAEIRRMDTRQPDLCQIALLHHQPEVLLNQNKWETLQERADITLHGHLHPDEPVIQKAGDTTSITGMAIYPHLPDIQRGFQILTLDEKKVVDVQKIICT